MYDLISVIDSLNNDYKTTPISFKAEVDRNDVVRGITVEVESTSDSIRISYSSGFCHLFNNNNLYVILDKDASNKFSHRFRNPRLCGSYIYSIHIDPVTPIYLTINEDGSTESIMGSTCNISTMPNTITQIVSGMVGTTKSLTRLRIRLVNDFGEPVHIDNPITVQLTVSPYIHNEVS